MKEDNLDTKTLNRLQAQNNQAYNFSEKTEEVVKDKEPIFDESESIEQIIKQSEKDVKIS